MNKLIVWVNSVAWPSIRLSKGVKPLIHQSEKIVPFKEKKFLSLCSIVKTTEWNRIIKIDNWS
jgi:hypothetical protein